MISDDYAVQSTGQNKQSDCYQSQNNQAKDSGKNLLDSEITKSNEYPWDGPIDEVEQAKKPVHIVDHSRFIDSINWKKVMGRW